MNRIAEITKSGSCVHSRKSAAIFLFSGLPARSSSIIRVHWRSFAVQSIPTPMQCESGRADRKIGDRKMSNWLCALRASVRNGSHGGTGSTEGTTGRNRQLVQQHRRDWRVRVCVRVSGEGFRALFSCCIRTPTRISSDLHPPACRVPPYAQAYGWAGDGGSLLGVHYPSLSSFVGSFVDFRRARGHSLRLLLVRRPPGCRAPVQSLAHGRARSARLT